MLYEYHASIMHLPYIYNAHTNILAHKPWGNEHENGQPNPRTSRHGQNLAKKT